VYAIRLGGAVRNNVVTHLAVTAFDSLKHFSGGYGKALCHDFEVMDERFHLRFHLLAVGKHDLGCIGLDGAFRHSVESLLNNLHALSHLDEAHFVTGPAVGVV